MKIGSIVDLPLHIDDRGNLSEIFRSDMPYFKEFGQVYIIRNEMPGIIRGFHFHKRKEDYFYCSSGKALVLLTKGRDGLNFKIERYVLDAKKPQLLIIPPNTYHGWKSLMPETHIINIVTEPFHKDDADDYRVEWDCFGKDIWGIEFK